MFEGKCLKFLFQFPFLAIIISLLMCPVKDTFDEGWETLSTYFKIGCLVVVLVSAV